MDFDFDNKTIGYFKLGDELEVSFRVVVAKGYSVHVKKGLVDGFRLFFSPQTDDGFIFEDRIIWQGRSLHICQLSVPEDIKAIFGAPIKVSEGDEFINMIFSQGKYEMRFCWSLSSGKSKQLEYLMIG